MKVEIGHFCDACDRSTLQKLDTASGEIECTRCTAVGILPDTEVMYVLADGERV
jgi:hypothetical protein